MNRNSSSRGRASSSEGEPMAVRRMNCLLQDSQGVWKRTKGVVTGGASFVITSYSIHYTKLYDPEGG